MAKSWSTAHDGFTYALLQLRAPQTVAACDDLAQDIYFLLDRSGSMEGGNWEMCAVALHAFVRELGTKDRVWITCFESGFQDFSDTPMPRDELLADESFLNLADIGVTGGTNLLPSLVHVLDKRAVFSQERPARLIVITDGQVGNEDEILNLMRQSEHAGLPVHTFGIDHAVNDAFLKSLARQTGGRCALMTPEDDIPAAVQRLAETLRRPVLTQLTVEGDVMTTNDMHQLADLHVGEVTTVAIRALGHLDQATISGHLPDGTAWQQSFPLQPDAEQPASRLQWVRQCCDHFLANGRSAKAIELAVAHNLVCQGTSFVAWDEAEKVTVAKREIYQPSMAQSSMDACYSMAPPPLRSPSKGSTRVQSMAAPPPLKASRKTRSRQDDSLNDLLNEVPGVAGTTFHSRSRMPAPEPDAIDQELRSLGIPPHFRILYRQVDIMNSADLPAWALPLREALVAQGVNPHAASLLVSILIPWAGKVIGQQRHKWLLALVDRMNASTTPLDELQHCLQALATERSIEDALLVLKAAAKKPHLSAVSP